MASKINIQPKKLLLVTSLGGLGYISNVLQWLWAGIVFLPLLIENQTVRDILLPQNTTPRVAPESVAGSDISIITVAIGVAVTVIMLFITIVILVRLPKTIASATRKTTTAAARAVVPVITHHQKLPAKKAKILTARVAKYLKFASCLLAVAVVPLIYLFDTSLPHTVILFVALTLAIGSLIWFTLQYAIAHAFNIPIEDIF